MNWGLLAFAFILGVVVGAVLMFGAAAYAYYMLDQMGRG